MDKGLYARPNKPRTTAVRQRSEAPVVAPLATPEPLILDRVTECHVTPTDVAASMVEYLDAPPDMLTLEPHAGTGALIQALLDAGHSQFEITAIERHVELWRATQKRFSSVGGIAGFNRCFLDYASEAQGQIEFPAIICNAPFQKIKKHMSAAISLLGPGGHDSATLVALVPISYEHPEADTMEELPIDTFSSAAVRTKIIRIIR